MILAGAASAVKSSSRASPAPQRRQTHNDFKDFRLFAASS
jgi:hypothetical protein